MNMIMGTPQAPREKCTWAFPTEFAVKAHEAPMHDDSSSIHSASACRQVYASRVTTAT